VVAGLTACAAKPPTDSTRTPTAVITQTAPTPDQGGKPTVVAPSSVDALSALLVAATDRDGPVTTATGPSAGIIRLTSGGTAASAGVLWGAQRTWVYQRPGTDFHSVSTGKIALS